MSLALTPWDFTSQIHCYFSITERKPIAVFLLNGQLFYAIFIPIVSAGGSPVWAIKVISPLLLGFLGLSMYAFAQKGLGGRLLRAYLSLF